MTDRPRRFAWHRLLCLGVLVLAASGNLLEFGVWRQRITLAPPFRPAGGLAWAPTGRDLHAPVHRLFDLPATGHGFALSTPEGELAPSRSAEDGPTATPGRYAYASGTLRFSTISGTDPNAFRTGIAVSTPVRLRRPILQALDGLGGIALGGLLVSWWRGRSGRIVARFARAAAVTANRAMRIAQARSRVSRVDLLLALLFALAFLLLAGLGWSMPGLIDRQNFEIRDAAGGPDFEVEITAPDLLGVQPFEAYSLFRADSRGPAAQSWLGRSCAAWLAAELQQRLGNPCGIVWRRLGPQVNDRTQVDRFGRGTFSIWWKRLDLSVPDESGEGGPRALYQLSRPSVLGYPLGSLLALAATWFLLRAVSTHRHFGQRRVRWVALAAACALPLLVPVPAFATGGLAVAVVLCLPVGKLSGGAIRIAAFAGGLLLALAIVQGWIQAGDLVRNNLTEQGRLTELALPQAVKRPSLLLVGSSYTEAGIIEATLETELARLGHPVEVRKLAWSGSTRLEQLHWLVEYLKHTPTPPDAVLIEISYGYDYLVFGEFEKNLFTTRMVETLDPATTLWALDDMVEDPHIPLAHRPLVTAEILAHAAMHEFGVGFLAKAAPRTGIEPAASTTWDANCTGADAAEIHKRLESEIAETAAGRTEPALAWAERLDRAELDLLRQAGIRRVAFNLPPDTNAVEFRYGRGICRRFSDVPCVVGDDPALLRELDTPSAWCDYAHLFGTARPAYARWLAPRLIRALFDK